MTIWSVQHLPCPTRPVYLTSYVGCHVFFTRIRFIHNLNLFISVLVSGRVLCHPYSLVTSFPRVSKIDWITHLIMVSVKQIKPCNYDAHIFNELCGLSSYVVKLIYSKFTLIYLVNYDKIYLTWIRTSLIRLATEGRKNFGRRQYLTDIE